MARSRLKATSLQQWIVEALGPERSDLVPVVMATLEKQFCPDISTMRHCWDEIKGALPGVPRKLMSDALAEDARDRICFEPPSCDEHSIWAMGMAVGFSSMLLPAVLGYLKEHGMKNEDLSPESMDHKGWYETWVPLIALYALEMGTCFKVSPKIAYNFVEQRSTDADLIPAVVNNISRQSVIATLLLLTAFAMLQGSPPVSDSRHTLFISQWYAGLALIAIAQLMLAVLTCMFVLLHIGPLDAVAGFKFVGDHFRNFGEPLSLIICALFNLIVAGIIWVFGTYGYGLGTVSLLTVAHAIFRTATVYLYFITWDNPFVGADQREKRKAHLSDGKATPQSEKVTPEGNAWTTPVESVR